MGAEPTQFLLVKISQIGGLPAKFLDVVKVIGLSRLAVDRSGQILVFFGQRQLHSGQILAILFESHRFLLQFCDKLFILL